MSLSDVAPDKLTTGIEQFDLDILIVSRHRPCRRRIRKRRRLRQWLHR
jgi:hypothetical protein